MLLSFLFLAQAQELPPPPIVNGEETNRFIQTGAIMYRFDGYGADVFCSGTLVHEKWVVTAAHCIDAVEEYSGYGGDILFVLGENLYSQEGISDYDEIIFWKKHPDYGGQRFQADIGVLELSEGFSGIPPIALEQRGPSEDWSGQEIIYVGWGVTGDNRSDSGKKRTASISYYDYDNHFVYSVDIQGDKNLCSGDSGGSALRIQPDGSYVLVGVNSFVFGYYNQNTACVGGGSGAARVDSNYEWLKQYIPDPDPLVFEPAKTGLGCAHQGGLRDMGGLAVASLMGLLFSWGRRRV